MEWSAVRRLVYDRMKILFVNTREPKCGVHQYGESLFAVLAHYIGPSEDHNIAGGSYVGYHEFMSAADHYKPDVVIYNWQAGIGGWMGGAPFPLKAKQVFVYHDLEANFDKFDAILFSDPTMANHRNWHSIGRPLRSPISVTPRNSEVPVIGINGFIGAWAQVAFSHIANTFERCHIRMHLPYAAYGDSIGDMARSAAQECVRSMPEGFTHEINHDFMDWDDLVLWLSRNDINCYLRDTSMHWRGVSSACDAAMCARRPIAVNGCNAFRHMHDCEPSIKVEDRSIREIMQTGLAPLIKKYNEYDPKVVGGQVMKVLESLVN